jgi:hypothetical protein
MRTLIVGALAATLAGCSCFLSPQSGLDACASGDAAAFGCYDRTTAASRFSQTIEPDASEPNSASQRARSPHAKAVKTSSARKDGTTRHARDEAKSTVANAEPPPAKSDSLPATKPPEAIDPVIDRAKIAVKVKLGNPASAAFGEMNRAMRKNMLGQSVDTICGRVKSKKTSGDGTEDRTFLYLVKEDEAYVADGSPTSAASSAYRNICS